MTAGFDEVIVENCLSSITYQRYMFLLGFAACLDAVSRGTIDYAEPIAVAMQAYEDVDSIGPEPGRVSNMMKEMPAR